MEAISIVLDVGASMREGPVLEDSPLEKAFFYNAMLSEEICPESSEVCMVKFGTAGTKNHLADGESYKNVTIAYPFGHLSQFDFYNEMLDTSEASSASGDFIEAVEVAIDHVGKEIQGKKLFASRKLLLLTDFGGEVSHKKIDAVVAAITQSKTKLFVIGLNPYKTRPQHHAGQAVLQEILKQVGQERYFISEFEETRPDVDVSQESGMKDVASAKVTVVKDPVELGSILISRWNEDKYKRGKLHQTIMNRCLPVLVKDLDFKKVLKYIKQKELFDDVTIRDIVENEVPEWLMIGPILRQAWIVWVTKGQILHMRSIRKLIKQIQQRDEVTYEKFKECLVLAGHVVLKDMLEREEAEEQKQCTGHVMISYRRVEKEKAFWIKRVLEKNGYSVWIDEDNLGTRVYQDMADGVEGAHVVLLCVSEEYKKSEFCRSEAEHAEKFKKNIIPVKVEDVALDGWLGILTASYSYVDLSGGHPSEKQMKLLFRKLAEYYKKEYQEPNIEPFVRTVVPDDGVSVAVSAESNPIQVDTSLVSETIMFENQDVKMTRKDLEKALAAGPDDDKARNIVDTIIQEGDEQLKTWLLMHLTGLLTDEMASVNKNAKFSIWPGTNISDGQIIFVCLHEDKLEKELKSFFKRDIFYKSIDPLAPLSDKDDQGEPLAPLSDKDYQGDPLAPLSDKDDQGDLKWTMRTEEALLIQSAIKEHGDRLFSQHSNLQVVCGGPFLLHEKQNLVQKSAAIILYCHAKGIKPYGEENFPSKLAFDDKDIPVDIREGHFALAVGNRDRHLKLCMGISIGDENVNMGSGTLGPFVKLDNNQLGFITCEHVVGQLGSPVVQPSGEDSQGQGPFEQIRCGMVLRSKLDYNIGVDAALVILNETRPVARPPTFPCITDADSSKWRLASGTQFAYTDGSIVNSSKLSQILGTKVIKNGRTTGLTMGLMGLDGMMVRYKNHIIKNLFFIESLGSSPFLQLGDSGSGIFILDQNNRLTLIGLLTGCTCSNGKIQGVATPIEDVLHALQLKQKALEI